MLDKYIRDNYYSRTVIILRNKGGLILEGKVNSPADIGKIVRIKRKTDGLTLVDAAALCNVGYRFFSNIENGKPTAHIGKILQVLSCLGLEVAILPRGWKNE
jgi:HTH-type transcriptional regulator/antitoxin HipB